MAKIEKHATETLYVSAEEPFLFESLERFVNQSDSPDNGEVHVSVEQGNVTITVTH